MSTAVAESRQDGQPTIRDRLRSPSMVAELGKAMPKHCSPERMARVAATALTKTPLLADCDQASFFQCLLSLSQWGLEPDGRRAHLIPFRNNKRNCYECQLIIDYKGLVELAYRSGVVKNIHADCVREGDLFEFDRGRVTKHTPWFLRKDADKPAKQGEVFAVYCLVELIGGAEKCEVMPREDVEKIRKRSRAGASGPWVTDWEEMAKKTVFRRVSKWLPLSAEIQDAFDKDADKFDPITVEPVRSERVTVDSLSQMLEASSYEPPSAAEEQAQASDTDESSSDWDAFQNALAAAESVKDVDAVSSYWVGKFSPDRNTEALRMAESRRQAVKGSKTGKQKSLVETSPTAQESGM